MGTGFGSKTDITDLNELYMPAYALTPPVIDGYMFLGWYTDEGKKWDFSVAPTQHMNLNALFLPSGYTLLNYIQINNSYINTGYAPTSKTRVIMRISNFPRTTTAKLFGSSSNNGKDDFYFYTSSSNYVTGYADQGTSTSYATNIDDSGIWTINKSRGITKIINPSGTETMNIEQIGKVFTGTQNLYIGTTNNNGTATGGYNNNTRIYLVMVFDETGLISAGIPSKNSSNIVGMYDCVNNVFYSSATGTAFIGG